ncbi:hypothetical protein C499_10854 [Halogeometricum borinquense DSM 11551]|nr:hypothetical protein [Halogeometricum borinquense]ELY27029.1 hypothetical protein C499_10854 [Halogeometricum borinquense DSM 11551]RYJ15111.1 hypothetical protein ELS19_14940 [Halogeometricum borinquense]
MFDKLGTKGIAGVVLLVAGIGIVAYQEPIVAAGIALVVAGLGLVASGLVQSVMGMFGMA